MADNLAGRRVLVVEDECLIAMDLCHVLGRRGATILGPVPSLQDAMRLVESPCEIDVAILDVNLNGESVYPLAEVLSARRVPYIFTTGYDKLGVPERYRSVPICGKPFHIETVVDVARQQIRCA